MKKFIKTILLSIFVLAGCSQETASIENNKAYLFYSQTCPHCHEARKYIGDKYPDANLIQVDVGTEKGKKMLFECAKRFNLGSNIGVPLFCMGENHLMGWSDNYKIKFDAYIRPYLKK